MAFIINHNMHFKPGDTVRRVSRNPDYSEHKHAPVIGGVYTIESTDFLLQGFITLKEFPVEGDPKDFWVWRAGDFQLYNPIQVKGNIAYNPNGAMVAELKNDSLVIHDTSVVKQETPYESIFDFAKRKVSW